MSVPAMDLVELAAGSEERDQLEYLLQLGTFRTRDSIQVINVWSVSSPILSSSFSRQTQGMQKIDAWMSAVPFAESKESAQEILRSLPSWKEFWAGEFQLSGSGNAFSVAFCSVAIGTSFFETSDTEDSTRAAVPKGYDSAHLKRVVDRPNGSGSAHIYIVNSFRQILPKYVISFKVSDNHSKREQMCKFCENREATVFCIQDRAMLCDKCDREIHSANKLVKTHERVSLSDPHATLAMGFGNCPIHSDVAIEFFCNSCQAAVCVHCKMVGNHSSGAAASHKLLPIKQAYLDAVQNANKPDPVSEEHKSRMKHDMSELDARISAIKENAEAVEKIIKDAASQALEQLNKICSDKTSIIRSEKAELQRREEEINWISSFLHYQQSNLSPVNFLSAWGRHVRFRTDLNASYSDYSIDRSVTVQPDIAVQGSLQITIEGPKDVSLKPSFQDESKEKLTKTGTLTGPDRFHGVKSNSPPVDHSRSLRPLRDSMLNDLDSPVRIPSVSRNADMTLLNSHEPSETASMTSTISNVSTKPPSMLRSSPEKMLKSKMRVPSATVRNPKSLLRDDVSEKTRSSSKKQSLDPKDYDRWAKVWQSGSPTN